MSQNMTESQARIAKMATEAQSLLQGIMESESRERLNDAELWLKRNERALRSYGVNPNNSGTIGTLVNLLNASMRNILNDGQLPSYGVGNHNVGSIW